MVDRRLASVNLQLRPHGRRREARTGFWRRLRLWAPQAMSRLRPQRTAKLRSRKIFGAGFSEKPAPHVASPPSPNSRFLWTLDEEGRFGAPHPVLVAAVGTNAPDRGESLEAFFRRVGLDGGDELARVLGERQTFSRVTLEWPLSGLDRRRLIALSAAPMFGRQREFLGYRGFGVLGEEIDAVAMPEGKMSAELAGDDRSALPEAFEPEPQAPESAARPVESSPEFAGTDGPDAPPSFLDADGIGAARAEAFEPEPSWPTSESEAEVQAPENAGEPVEPNLELPAADAPDAPPPEASLEAEGPKSASALTEANDSDAPAVETAPPDLAERSAASESQPSPPERTAAIYVLRHPSPAVSSNIVPIRPGALDALAREIAPELSRRERGAQPQRARRVPGNRARSGRPRAGFARRVLGRTGRRGHSAGSSGSNERRAADGPARRCWGGARRRRRRGSAQRRRGSGPSAGWRPRRPRRAGALRQPDAA